MYTDRLLMVFILGIYLLSPTLLEWWTASHLSWILPYLIWGFLILLSYWIIRIKHRGNY